MHLHHQRIVFAIVLWLQSRLLLGHYISGHRLILHVIGHSKLSQADQVIIKLKSVPLAYGQAGHPIGDHLSCETK